MSRHSPNMIHLVVLAVSLGSASGLDSLPGNIEKLFCKVARNQAFEDMAASKVCSAIEHVLNFTSPTCQASAKKVWESVAMMCPTALESSIDVETTPADFEKLLCKIAHNQAVQDMMTTKACDKMQHALNLTVPNCEGSATKIWNVLASQCPKASLGASLTKTSWRNCKSSQFSGELNAISFWECHPGPMYGLQTTCTGIVHSSIDDDIRYDLSVKEQDSGSVPFPEPYQFSGHCETDASEPEVCYIQNFPWIGDLASLTMSATKLPVKSGNFSVTVGINTHKPYLTDGAFFFQGTSKSGTRLFCLEIDFYKADSAKSSKLAPLVVV